MKREKQRSRRKMSVRRKIFGSPGKPRMSVHKSLKTITVQIIDDVQSKTICGLSTLTPSVREKLKAKSGKNIDAAKVLGTEIAKLAAEKNVKKIVFDRSRYLYHGAVKALAEAARKAGLEF
ncbi:MAG: 50S ribosomal protein L18 [Candidatus Omnitrophota bacterium]